MKQKIFYLIILNLSLLFNSCYNPVAPIEEHLKKLWEFSLSGGSAFSNLTTTDNFILFKTSINPTGKFYKIKKDGKSVQIALTGGCTVGTPTFQDNIIYTNNCTGSLYALKKDDLSVIWSRSDFIWIPIPAIDENNLFVTDWNIIFRLDKTNGNTVWSTEITGKNGANPIIENENLYFTTGSVFFEDGYLYSINKNGGTINYRITIPYLKENSQLGGSRAGVEIWNDLIFVSGDNQIFYCFNKITGDLVWSFLADAPIQVTPKVSEGYVYFGTLNRTCYAINASTGEVKWTYQGGGSMRAEPSFYQNYVMFKSLGALLILDKYSGTELFKMSSSTTEFGFSNAYWDTDGRIYAGGHRESDQQSFLIVYQFK